MAAGLSIGNDDYRESDIETFALFAGGAGAAPGTASSRGRPKVSNMICWIELR